MASDKFKKGDIISPLKNRIKSNDTNLKNIEKLEVIDIRNRSWTRHQLLNCKILKGFVSSYGQKIAIKNNHIQVYNDAFKLYNNTEKYSIY